VGDPQLVRGGDGGTAFSKLGDGTKRRLILSIQSWANQVFRENLTEIDQTMIFAFDEPDTRLHYEAQYELLQILREMTENRMQIFICTHSIPIIDRLPARSVRLMKPDRESRDTTVVWVTDGVEDMEVSEFLSTVGHGLGFANSILFYERCFLIVEGETEAKALPGLYKKIYGNAMIEDGIRLFSAESGGAAKKLSKLLSEHDKSAISLLDSDMKNDADD
jgi:putative ATP-dependent endonuclease of OLD family